MRSPFDSPSRTISIPSSSSSSAKGTCLSELREEFRLKNLLFDYDDVRHFGRLQWSNSKVIYIAYRAVLFLYYLVWLIYEGVIRDIYQGHAGLFFVFLSNLSYLMLTLYMLYAFIVSLVLYIQDRRGTLKSNQPMPLYVKALWILHVIVADVAIFVTVVYWSILYSPGKYLPFHVDFHLHAFNTIGLVLDLALSNTPVRLLHFWLGQCGATVYILITVVFWASGGSIKGHNYIYSTLDYSGNPSQAALIVVLSILLAIPAVHSVLFGMFKIRQVIHRRISLRRKQEDFEFSPRAVVNPAFSP